MVLTLTESFLHLSSNTMLITRPNVLATDCSNTNRLIDIASFNGKCNITTVLPINEIIKTTDSNFSIIIHFPSLYSASQVILSDEFDILQIVGEGWFGKILLVEHRATDTEMVLKALPKPYVSLRDFYREFHYGLHLGVHKNIVTTYDVAFETAGFYVFTQEYAPLGISKCFFFLYHKQLTKFIWIAGDLTSNVLETGIGELHTKRVAKQIGSALDFMHLK